MYHEYDKYGKCIMSTVAYKIVVWKKKDGENN